jgi:AraC-like DNA-binding protein
MNGSDSELPRHSVASPKRFYRYFPIANRDKDWGLFVTTVGEFHFPSGKVSPPPDQPKRYDFKASTGRLLHEFQIVYVSAGRGWFKSDESGRIPVNTGNVILLFPGVRHWYTPLAATGWKEHWLGFSGHWARRLARHGFFSPNRPVLHAGKEDQLLFLFNELMEATRTNPPALQQIMAAITLRILSQLYSIRQTAPVRDDRTSRIIHTAISRMRGETIPNMEKLASELNVSYRWFRAAFSRHTGMSPHKYVLEIRLARARGLLAQTSLSTKEIAYRIGFEDAQYFCRLFHNKVGLTPGKWRERALQGQSKSLVKYPSRES